MRSRWLTPDAPGAGYVCRLLKIPNSVAFQAIVSGALDDLQQSYNFEQQGSLTPEETAALFAQMFDDYRQDRGCMIGTIFPYATSVRPAGSLDCDGSTYLRSDYPALYAVLAPAFIADADHFFVPDLRGRAVVGAGQGPGLTGRLQNDAGGEEAHQLSVDELPNHQHFYNSPLASATLLGDIPTVIYASIVGALTSIVGSSQTHNNMQPFRCISYAIWTV